MPDFPRRLIEVDLPIKAISANARREKSIRHGHISTLHIWWARRPLVACRAVLCAALWPDPLDAQCPQAFRDLAALALNAFSEEVRNDPKLAKLCADHWTRWVRTTIATLRGDQPACWADLRYGLLDFIADFANWDASTLPAFLETARILTHVAHLSLTIPDFRFPVTDFHRPQTAISNLKSQIENLPRPLVVDPFAGGGSIPLEALRIGADAFASDLNPVAVLLNKVVLEYIPKYGNALIESRDAEGNPIVFNGLAEAVRYWGIWIKEQAEKELAPFYPKDMDGAIPIAYLWARTITCEGPGCGAEVPLIRSLWLAKKGERSVALRLLPDRKNKRINFEIIAKHKGKWYPQDEIAAANPQSEIKNPQFDGTVRRGSATCPVCGYTTPVEYVRAQLKARRGGANDARLFCVVTTHIGEQGRFFRLPTERDLHAVNQAVPVLEYQKGKHTRKLSMIPSEELDIRGIRHTWAMIYGLEKFGDMFNPRQLLTLTTLVKNSLITIDTLRLLNPENDDFIVAISACIALAISRHADINSSLSLWHTSRELITHTFGRQAIGMVWDYTEANSFSDASGSFSGGIDWIVRVLEQSIDHPGQAEQISATKNPLPNDSAHAFITDPPYYDSVPYAHLSDFFYVWLRRMLGTTHNNLFVNLTVPKDEEIVVDRPHELSDSTHDISYYERELTKAFAEGQRVLSGGGIGTIVFASKTTASWEAILQAVVEGGWIITGSWPIDTEMETRVAAQGQARLASSIHLVCRPREMPDGNVIDEVGDWREVLQALPARIHEWLPRLAREGIVGADAIFACLGPALEIFSRYSRVEKASGEQVQLREYLEHVWAAVSREALSMIFEAADASGFEEDARLTAMWLWTLKAESWESRAGNGNGSSMGVETSDAEEEADTEKPTTGLGMYSLEYDAARKIAQGLGAHLEKLESLVEVQGDKARLRSVRERARTLFGKGDEGLSGRRKTKESAAQLSLFSLMENTELTASEWKEAPAFKAGRTVLDCIHQAMLLFAYGRGEALKRILVDQGIGREARFWRLAQALSALYPSSSDEKRWVDGVLARKKGLGY